MWSSGERWFPLENMPFKAHRLPQLSPTHLMLSSLLWLYISPILANKKPSSFSLIQSVGGTLSLYTSKLLFQRSQPHLWCLPSLVSSKCLWEDVVCTDSAAVTGLCQAGCSKIAWTVAHPSLVPKHFTIILSSLRKNISPIYMGTQDYISLWLYAVIFCLTWKYHNEMRELLLELDKPEEVDMCHLSWSQIVKLLFHVDKS